MSNDASARTIGLDLHKHYLIAVAVNQAKEPIWGPARARLTDLIDWARKYLRPTDHLVFEMTTNTWQVYEDLRPFVADITVVHPPHVALIVRAKVMTDAIAAQQLARLHVAGLLKGLWIPPIPIRELRSLLAQRRLLVRLATQAKNRLHAVLHRHHLSPPPGDLFAPAQGGWWRTLPVSPVEHTRIECDLATLAFADEQRRACEVTLTESAAHNPDLPRLLQLPGIGLVSGLTVWSAVGDILRFPSAEELVGYAGLGTRVHASGLTYRTGRITKAGRRELRTALVEAAQSAANTHPFWQTELARLEPRLGRNKAIVAIARKLLVALWHVWHDAEADRHAEVTRVARKLLQHAYRLGKRNRSAGQTTAAYVRQQLDRLGLGRDLTEIQWGRRVIKLPPSTPIPLPLSPTP